MGTVIQSSTNNQVEVIDRFVKELNDFIKESIAILNQMKSKHQQMGYHWKGQQYDNFTTVLVDTIKDAAKELAELENLRKQLVEKSKILSKRNTY